MSDCFDHQMDAFDCYENFGYGHDYGSPSYPSDSYEYKPNYYSVIEQEAPPHETRKAVCIIAGGELFWVPLSMCHLDKARGRVWAFKRDVGWWQLPHNLKSLCQRWTAKQIWSR